MRLCECQIPFCLLFHLHSSENQLRFLSEVLTGLPKDCRIVYNQEYIQIFKGAKIFAVVFILPAFIQIRFSDHGTYQWNVGMALPVVELWKQEILQILKIFPVEKCMKLDE